MSDEIQFRRLPARVARWQSRYPTRDNESPTTTDDRRSSRELCPAVAFDSECWESCAASRDSVRTRSARAILSRQVLSDCFRKPVAARWLHLRRGVENG